MPAHKHAAVIKAWADGAEIEFRIPDTKGKLGEWNDIDHPCWADNTEYRLKPVPHKWQKEMDALYKEGKDIQCRTVARPDIWSTWLARDAGASVDPRFNDAKYEFRIKPEKVEKEGWCYITERGEVVINDFSMWEHHNLKLTFEGDELISAQVLK